jgi:hypothetical protein
VLHVLPFIFLNLITLIFREEYKLWSFSYGSFLRPPVTCSVFHVQILSLAACCQIACLPCRQQSTHFNFMYFQILSRLFHVFFTLSLLWNILKYGLLILRNIPSHFFFHDTTAPSRPGSPHCQGFTITLRHTTLARTPLDEWSAQRRDLYVTTNHTHNRQTSMPPLGFEPTIPASEGPQTHTWDRAATGVGKFTLYAW